jgi:YHS domain-containing protein
MYDTKVILPRKAEKLTMRDVLTDALAQISINRPCTFQVRGSQLLIVPAYVPPVRPGANPLVSDDQEPPMVEAHLLNEQIYGGVVSVHAERKPLAEVLADLRKQTGANIVLDPRCEGLEKKATINVTLNDVRLYDALRVIADMSELKMVYAGNIYYVTTPANAKTFEPAPRPPQPQAPGFPGFPQTGPPVPNPPAPAPQ